MTSQSSLVATAVVCSTPKLLVSYAFMNGRARRRESSPQPCYFLRLGADGGIFLGQLLFDSVCCSASLHHFFTEFEQLLLPASRRQERFLLVM